MSSLVGHRVMAARGRCPNVGLFQLWRRRRQGNVVLQLLPLHPSRTLSTSMSMNMNTNTGSNSSGGVRQQQISLIPIVHSRKRLPPVCTDVEELQQRTQHVLTTEVGNLFQFDRGSRSMDAKENREAAWERADGTVQMVEFLIRGYSAQIPGTLWHQWATPRTTNTRGASVFATLSAPTVASDPLTNLEIIVELLDRMWAEGLFYMEVRKSHMSQVVLEEELRAQEEKERLAKDWRAFVRGGLDDSDDEDDDEDAAAAAMDDDPTKSSRTGRREQEDMKQLWENMQTARRAARKRGEIDADMDFPDDEEKDNENSEAEVGEENNNDDGEGGGGGGVMEHFALPGPTTEMYDVLLDTMAITAETAGDPKAFGNRPASQILTADSAFDVLEVVEQRHALDGDDLLNDNIHTMTTQISYNAVIRTCLNLYWDGQDEEIRDAALNAAMAAHNNLTCASGIHHNSSSYAYLMLLVSKYLPACKSRGNMIHGLWKMAKQDGVYNGEVQQAYLEASEPSNSPEHDEFVDEWIRNKDWRTDVPQRWRRCVKKFRMVRKQTTY